VDWLILESIEFKRYVEFKEGHDIRVTDGFPYTRHEPSWEPDRLEFNDVYISE
jgi:hypothetical protein